jgi:hypothetical protein
MFPIVSWTRSTAPKTSLPVCLNGACRSVYRNGVHHESMLALPELGRVLVTGSTPPRHAPRIHGFSSSATPKFLGALPPGQEYRISGCAVCNLYSVIAGSFYSFENPHGAHNWDPAHEQSSADCLCGCCGPLVRGQNIRPSFSAKVFAWSGASGVVQTGYASRSRSNRRFAGAQ